MQKLLKHSLPKKKKIKACRGEKNIIGNSSLAKTVTIRKNSHLNTFQ